MNTSVLELRRIQAAGKIPTAEDVTRAMALASEIGTPEAAQLLESIQRRNRLVTGSTSPPRDRMDRNVTHQEPGPIRTRQEER